MQTPWTARPPGAKIRHVEAFQEGQKIWVEQSDGSQRAAIYVGEAALDTWFGGGPGVYVVYPETRSGEEVAAFRVIPRDE